MREEQIKGDVALLFVTLIWGSTFITVKKAVSSIPVFNFLALRFLLAFFALAIIFYKPLCKNLNFKTLFFSFMTGSSLFLGYALQTLGLKFTTASKSGFITGFSVILVPLLEAIFLKKKPNRNTTYGIILAFIGLGLLSVELSDLRVFKINIGDFYTFLCALFFSLQIILISMFVHIIDPISFAVYQIGFVAVLSTIFSLMWEKPVLPTDGFSWVAIVITGLLATALAYTVQNMVQKYTTATHAALIYTAEPIFSAVFAYIFAGEVMTSQVIIGAIFVLAGMVLSEIY